MLGDLLRCASSSYREGGGHEHDGHSQHNKSKSSKAAQGGTAAYGGHPSNEPDSKGVLNLDDELNSDFEDEPEAAKRTKHDEVKAPISTSSGDVTDAIQRFKRERERPKKANEWTC